MPTPPLSREQAEAYLKAVEEKLRAGDPPPGASVPGRRGAIYSACEALGVSRSGASSRLARAVRIAGRNPDWGAYTPAAADPVATVDRQLRERADAQDAAALRAQIAALQDRLLAAERWERRAQTALAAPKRPAAWPKPAVARKSARELVPLLLASDFQAGEVVRADQVDGLNAYNIDVFRARYADMIGKTIALMTGHTGAGSFPGCVYVNLGDLISGEIHEELAVTNDLSAVPALMAVYECEREGIRRLREAFGRVRCIRVAGNHDRTTLKPRSKDAGEHSYAMLVSYMLRQAFEADPKVEIIAPSSADATFRLYDWTFLATHGDRMGSSGGRGFIGSAAPIARGHQKLIADYAYSGVNVDCVLTGHLHTSLKLTHGYANGSVAGYTQYGRDARYAPAPAQQWLLGVHREHMVAHAFELNLSRRPRRGAAPAF